MKRLNTKAHILVWALLIFGQPAEAGVWTNGNLEISHIIWRPGYHGFYTTGGSFHNPEGCSGSSHTNLYLFDSATEADVETMNRLFTLMTMAMATDRKIHAWVDGCSNSIPLVKGIQLNG